MTAKNKNHIFLTLLASALLLLILFQVHHFKSQIFLTPESLSPVEILMLIEMLFVVLYFLASIIWLINSVRRAKGAGDYLLILYGMFCLALLVVEKVMVDEIGREIRLGWETTGEMGILHACLLIQIVYCFAIWIRIRVAGTFRQA